MKVPQIKNCCKQQSSALLLKFFVFHEWFKLWAARNCEVQSLGSEERLHVKQIEVVVINEISQQLIGQTVQC